MSARDVTSMRSSLEYLESMGHVVRVKEEVDPIYEIAGIQKALEKGPILLFEKIKGYPDFMDIGNFFGRRETIADLYGVEETKDLKVRFVEALREPLPPVVVEDAPVQEEVLTENVDIPSLLPILKHTERDAGRIMGCGIQLLTDTYRKGDSNLSYNRIHFRGKDWASISTAQITHIGMMAFKTHRDKRIPITVNINPSPAVQMVAGTWNVRTIVPHGGDELGIAGGFQGEPVRLVKAKTVDAYAIADAEIVLEGYLEPHDQNVWESDESEANKEQVKYPYFPEWVGYLGRAWRVRKLQITAVTMRKKKPVYFYTPLAAGLEYAGFDLLREATFFEMAERIAPGICADVFIPDYFKWGSGVIFQVRKQSPQEEGFQKNILYSALADAPGIRMAIAVDEDVDIYNADDIMWALESRVDPDKDILKLPSGGRGIAAQPGEVRQRGVGGWEGGMAFDATKSFLDAWKFERPAYPVDKIDLNKYFSDEQIKNFRQMQSEYARTLAKRGW